MIEFRENYRDKRIKDIILKDKDKKIEIFFGGNLDLYFNILGEEQEIESKTFNGKNDFFISNQDEAWIYFNRLINEILADKTSNDMVNLVKDNVINWYSDDTYVEGANLLSIQKENEGIRLTFFDNPNDSDCGIPIRICNSGSRYNPFNIHFMKMFQEFQELARNQDKKIEDEER